MGPRTLCNACGVRYKKDLPLNCWPIRDGMVLPPVRLPTASCLPAWPGMRLRSAPALMTNACRRMPALNRITCLLLAHEVRRLPAACLAAYWQGWPPAACHTMHVRLTRMLCSRPLQGAVLPAGFVVPPGITIHTQPADWVD